MLPVWNCANPLTANSEMSSAAVNTAINLGVGHHFIAAPFCELLPNHCRPVAAGHRTANWLSLKYVVPPEGCFRKGRNSSIRWIASCSLNRLGIQVVSEICGGSYQNRFVNERLTGRNRPENDKRRECSSRRLLGLPSACLRG